MNEELVDEISKAKTIAEEEAKEHKITTWLIFSICDKKYAIKSSSVTEIIRDIPVYKLPFVPQYIEGVLNRRGDPFTVINPLAIIDSNDTQQPKEPLFLVLNFDNDQLSIHISDILFFKDIEDSDINSIPNSDEESFFIGTIHFNHDEIPVLNPEAFEILIRNDLGSA